MKNIIPLFFLSIITLSCSSSSEDVSVVDSTAGKYYYIKNVSKNNGVITLETNHENTCTGKTNYNIKKDKSVEVETWYAPNPKSQCIMAPLAFYTYDTNNQTIDGQKVTFEGNLLILSQAHTNGAQTIENIYYYKKQ